ncbi:uncharacterized protein I206_100071 [Kwoniella pini CBS 10737]|uniref:Uncharacterized protein n=1 Tax=Kwoniella pini CBS 10737 TaxID=1296096 RepID=A0A1B9HSG2_9TREE|nr:uncharacterized protein I206_07886 [Kwoniella pini CBS 10737]OCF46215.1 hypothetical protein I206_07886 [Kwoniella pini CBS 10737]
MSGDEDMTLTPLSGTVELSFDTRKGGAWDDRELIRASEAAMKEFHVHHPGPGSWLDKATAALAAGHKLPGADDYGTSWYSASLPENQPEAEASTSTSIQTTQNTNKRRRTKKLSDSNINGDVLNPYAPQESIDRRASPIYQPGSPNNRPIDLGPLDSSDEEDDEEEEEDEYDEDAEWDLPNGHNQNNLNPIKSNNQGGGGGYDQLFPSLGVYPPGGINKEEALGYAMTAQYWAGYWMGVAQSSSSAPYTPFANQGHQVEVPDNHKRKSDKRNRRKRTQVDFVNDNQNDEDEEEHGLIGPTIPMGNGIEHESGNNIRITRKQFDRPPIELRR